MFIDHILVVVIVVDDADVISLSLKTKIADLVQIRPQDFNKTSIHAIEDNINAKYANKVRSPTVTASVH